MKIGDLVFYTLQEEGHHADDDRLGIIMSFDEHHEERIWVHWFVSGEEQWAAPEWMEVLSANR